MTDQDWPCCVCPHVIIDGIYHACALGVDSFLTLHLCDRKVEEAAVKEQVKEMEKGGRPE
jgi:hypothetical protein